jgi:hypothetical protein
MDITSGSPMLSFHYLLKANSDMAHPNAAYSTAHEAHQSTKFISKDDKSGYTVPCHFSYIIPMDVGHEEDKTQQFYVNGKPFATEHTTPPQQTSSEDTPLEKQIVEEGQHLVGLEGNAVEEIDRK